MRRRLIVTLGVALLAGLVSAVQPRASGTTALRRPCDGKERWAIKTLADADAGEIKARAKKKSVRQLWAMKRPRGFNERIRNRGAETTVYEVKASLVEVRWVNNPRTRNRKTGKLKKGGDLDIHLVIAPANDPTDKVHTMVVEFPFPRCVDESARWKPEWLPRAMHSLPPVATHRAHSTRYRGKRRSEASGFSIALTRAVRRETASSCTRSSGSAAPTVIRPS